MSHEPQHGRFVWTELMTRRAAAAVEFYGAVLGWTTEDVPMADDAYTMFHAGGVAHAGLFDIPETMEAPAAWLPYVSVDDVDAAVIRCQEEGGALLAPARDIPDVGRFAVLADPAGAAVAVFRSVSPRAAETGAPPMGEFSWRELSTGDVDRACDFLFEMFGWERGPAHDMGPAGSYQLLVRAGGPPFAGVYRATEGVPPAWTSYVRVADLEAAAVAVERCGGRIVAPPMEVPGGDRVAVGTDPEGARFGLHWISAA